MAKTTTALADGDLQFGADETRDAAPDDKTALPARGEGGRRLGHDPFPAARILRWQDGRRRRNHVPATPSKALTPKRGKKHQHTEPAPK
jgi:hypothetical protein